MPTSPDINYLKEKLRGRGLVPLLIVENSSRSKGYNSPQSDHDVCFIYKHENVRDYFRLSQPDNHLSWNYEGNSYTGWELKKALGLAYKSNAQLMEWLWSPSVYFCEPDFRRALRIHYTNYFCPKTYAHNYFNIAQGILKGRELSTLSLKEFIVASRSALIVACLRGRPWVSAAFYTIADFSIRMYGNHTNELDRLYFKRVRGETTFNLDDFPYLREFLDGFRGYTMLPYVPPRTDSQGQGLDSVFYDWALVRSPNHTTIQEYHVDAVPQDIPSGLTRDSAPVHRPHPNIREVRWEPVQLRPDEWLAGYAEQGSSGSTSDGG